MSEFLVSLVVLIALLLFGLYAVVASLVRRISDLRTVLAQHAGLLEELQYGDPATSFAASEADLEAMSSYLSTIELRPECRYVLVVSAACRSCRTIMDQLISQEIVDNTQLQLVVGASAAVPQDWLASAHLAPELPVATPFFGEIESSVTPRLLEAHYLSMDGAEVIGSALHVSVG